MTNTSDPDTPPPVHDALAIWAAVRPIFAELFGEDAVTRIENDADPTVFLTAPNTFFARILEAAKSGSGANATDWTRIAEHLPALVARVGGLRMAREAQDQEILKHPAGDAVRTFLVTCRSKLGDADIAAAIEEPRTLTVAALLKPGVNLIPASPEKDTFEAHAARTSTQLKKVAESFYRPMLASVLKLTRALRGQSTPIPSDLGKVMKQCQELWQNGTGPSVLLVPEIRVIRNAEAHEGVVFDPRAETITFENHKQDGTVESVGPWSKEQFGSFVGAFMRHCVAMWTAFRTS